jgi:hypothetical protein
VGIEKDEIKTSERAAAGELATPVAGRRCPHAPLTDRLADPDPRRREWRGGLGFDGAPSIRPSTGGR